MSTRPCDRAALVEAMVDGRLGPSELGSTERHVRGCSSCAELLRDLTSLRQALRSSSPTLSPLEHQRARLALLRQAATPPARARRPVVLLAAALVTLPFAVWAATSLTPRRTHEVPRLPASSTPATAPTPQSTLTMATTPRPLSSDEPAPAASSVTADEAPVPSLVQSFPTAPAPLASTVAVLASSGPTPLSPRSWSTPPEPARRSSGPGASSAASSAPPRAREEGSESPAPAVPSAAGSSHEFNEAMAALARGDFGASASQLDGFASAHPGDPRAEEAAYLKAIALERAGRLPEARAAARRYLTVYPAGAHRAQARRMAGD